MEPHSWLYLLQLVLILMFVALLFLICASWVIYYWFECEIDAEVRIANMTGPPINAVELQNMDDVGRAVEGLKNTGQFSNEDIDKLLHKDPESGLYTHMVDDNGRVVPVNVGKDV